MRPLFIVMCSLVGCTTHYRVVTIHAPPAEVLDRIDADAKAANFSKAGDTPGAPATYTKVVPAATGGTLTKTLTASVQQQPAGTRVIVTSEGGEDVSSTLLPDEPALTTTDYASPERDFAPAFGEYLHLQPYFNWTTGQSRGAIDHRFYFGIYAVVRVAEWGDGMTLEPSTRRRVWVGLGGDLCASCGDDPVKRGYLALHYQHGEVRSLDGARQIQSDFSYSYQLAVSMLRVSSPRRTEVMLVMPWAAMGLVAQVGWDWADDRNLAWSIGVRVPLPLSVGFPVGPVHLPSVPFTGGR